LSSHPRRLGIVRYYNMLPLIEGLGETFPESHWVRATPRELATMLADGRLDIAAVSTFEGLRQSPHWVSIPGAAIASRGAVRSVALYSRVPIPEIRSVLLDRASLTSINLAGILLAEIYGLRPAMELSAAPLGIDDMALTAAHDAAVVIGDTALAWEGRWPHTLDLGEAWWRHTGLPFVFACWWRRADVVLTPAEEAAFVRARLTGTGCIDTIVARLAPEEVAAVGGRDNVARYLRENICYELGERELAGLDLFHRKLREHGLLPD
jgi:chorismate dehydratase